MEQNNWQNPLSNLAGMESSRYFSKWLVIATLIGIVAGVGAIVFYTAIHLATALLLGGVAGYQPPDSAGEGETIVRAISNPLLLPIVVAAGGLLSGLIVFLTAPEAEGHGTDAAIDAFHHKAGFIRARIPIIKLVASAITIGSGGSGGREGPTAQISAGFGSLLGTLLKLDERERRIAVATGIGAGIGAIFKAPLGGAILAAEILYIHDLEAEAIIPSLIASIVGYSIFGLWYGWTPVFGHLDSLTFDNPIQLVYYAILGLICGGVGIIYARTFYGTGRFFKRIPLPNWSKPAIGGLAVGLMGLVLPQALGMGYGWVQIGMTQDVLGMPLWIVLIIPFAKIVATSLSIGSGGSGGIFGPGMVIGGMVGAGFWRLLAPVLPGMPAGPAPFVIIAMMAMFGGIAHAPVAVMLMVAEMTGNLTLLGPAMVAVAIATLVVGNHTIYESQLDTRADSPAHRSRLAVPLLRRIRVWEALTPISKTVTAQATAFEIEAALDDGVLPVVPVVDERGTLVGEVTADALGKVLPEDRGSTPAIKLMLSNPPVVAESDPLDQALALLGDRNVHWVLVVDDVHAHRPIGIVTAAGIAQAYATSLGHEANWTAQLAREAEMLEQTIEIGSPLEGQTLRDAKLPAGALVVAVRRNGRLVIPNGATHLQAGDKVLALIHRPLSARIKAML